MGMLSQLPVWGNLVQQLREPTQGIPDSEHLLSTNRAPLEKGTVVEISREPLLRNGAYAR